MRGVPSSKGSKVAGCEKDLMMQAFVALIVRAGRLSSRGTTVRTGRFDGLSGLRSPYGIRCHNLIDC